MSAVVVGSLRYGLSQMDKLVFAEGTGITRNKMIRDVTITNEKPALFHLASSHKPQIFDRRSNTYDWIMLSWTPSSVT